MISSSRFVKNQQGSVTIEFVFAIIVMCLLLIFMFDLSMFRLQMGKLDNVSYSLVNILRERRQLFNTADGKEYSSAIQASSENMCEAPNSSITSHDCASLIQTFEGLANKMFYGTTMPKGNRRIYIRLDDLEFKPLEKGSFAIENHWVVTNFKDNELMNRDCVPTTNILTLRKLAPISEINNHRKLPLYQVTLCIPSYSLFAAITHSGGDRKILRSSSIAVGR
ncbi:tight adherence pilus pseudopilin TadF [Actinobacillus delphinicola]|uniref:Tight adherence protein F n=1 Tax=Actinobacillus delphinicola TaxID=51161 RepID=A0A448TVE5_9PAST|nr:tight adherence pilus pseudopilin TadF [Actinobacillus delphinicola]VEJ09899.1 tight adherence protein F [Actinobacillus delphinicola]